MVQLSVRVLSEQPYPEIAQMSEIMATRFGELRQKIRNGILTDDSEMTFRTTETQEEEEIPTFWFTDVMSDEHMQVQLVNDTLIIQRLLEPAAEHTVKYTLYVPEIQGMRVLESIEVALHSLPTIEVMHRKLGDLTYWLDSCVDLLD